MARRPAAEPDTINFLGLRIKRQIDLLSIPSIILSLIALTVATLGFIQGPNVEMLPPEQITFFMEKGADTVRLLASNYFFNTGAQGHDAIVEKITATFTLPPSGTSASPHRVELTWQYRTQSETTANEGLRRSNLNASPFAVPAGSTAGYEHDFAPRRASTMPYDANWIDMQQFLGGLKALPADASGDRALTMTFIATMRGRPGILRGLPPLRHEVRILIAPNLIDTFARSSNFTVSTQPAR